MHASMPESLLYLLTKATSHSRVGSIYKDVRSLNLFLLPRAETIARSEPRRFLPWITLFHVKVNETIPLGTKAETDHQIGTDGSWNLYLSPSRRNRSTPLANSLAAGPLIRFRSPLHPSNGPSCETRVPVRRHRNKSGNKNYKMDCYRSRSSQNRSTPCYFSRRRPLQMFVALSIPPAAVDGDRPA
jgi:hypothetical protein